MNDFDRHHLLSWIQRTIAAHRERERMATYDAITALVKDDPQLLYTHGWTEIRRMCEDAIAKAVAHV